MGFCPAWNGLRDVGLKGNGEAYGTRPRQTLSPAKIAEAASDTAWQAGDDVPHTNEGSRTGPAVVVVSRRLSVCLINPGSTGRTLTLFLSPQAQWDCASKASLRSEENCSFVLHDCGGEGPHGEMYVSFFSNLSPLSSLLSHTTHPPSPITAPQLLHSGTALGFASKTERKPLSQTMSRQWIAGLTLQACTTGAIFASSLTERRSR